MKAINEGNGFLQRLILISARALMVAGLLFCVVRAQAQIDPSGGGYYGPTNAPLDSWSFYDHTNWTSDLGYAPVSFINLNFSYLGDGASLVVDILRAREHRPRRRAPVRPHSAIWKRWAR